MPFGLNEFVMILVKHNVYVIICVLFCSPLCIIMWEMYFGLTDYSNCNLLTLFKNSDVVEELLLPALVYQSNSLLIPGAWGPDMRCTSSLFYFNIHFRFIPVILKRIGGSGWVTPYLNYVKPHLNYASSTVHNNIKYFFRPCGAWCPL